MNPYLERLKSIKGPHTSVPEVSEPASGTSGTSLSGLFSRNDVCAGLPLDEDSGTPFCPWGPYVSPAMLDAWRCELRDTIDELATIEGWTTGQREQVAYYVEHQPGLATLRDDIAYFTERLNEARRATTTKSPSCRRTT
jgi:hypothetical protein